MLFRNCLHSVYFLYYTSIVVLATIVSEKGNDFNFCAILQNSKSCLETANNEIDQWDCYGKYLFRNVTIDSSNEFYLEHDCGGVGWYV